MNISFTHVSLIFTTAANMYGMCQFEVAPAERKKKKCETRMFTPSWPCDSGES